MTTAREPLPESLAAFAQRVRLAYKAGGTLSGSVSVKASLADLRAINAQQTALKYARDQRDKYKRLYRGCAGDLNKVRNDITDHELICDRAVLRALDDAEYLATGGEMSELEVHAFRERLGALRARAKKIDKRKVRRK